MYKKWEGYRNPMGQIEPFFLRTWCMPPRWIGKRIPRSRTVNAVFEENMWPWGYLVGEAILLKSNALLTYFARL